MASESDICRIVESEINTPLRRLCDRLEKGSATSTEQTAFIDALARSIAKAISADD